MATNLSSQRLGEMLQEAQLINEAQIQVALQDQQYSPLPIGEILVVRGWLQQETADFFAESWAHMVRSGHRRPLGYYLQQAYLLKEHQISQILEEQKKLGVRFGSVAVLKGWLKQGTVDYFLEHLIPEAKSTSAFQGKTSSSTTRTTKAQEHTAFLTGASPSSTSSSSKTTQSRIFVGKAAASVTTGSYLYTNPGNTKSNHPSRKTANGRSFASDPNSEDFDLSAALGSGSAVGKDEFWEDRIWID